MFGVYFSVRSAVLIPGGQFSNPVGGRHAVATGSQTEGNGESYNGARYWVRTSDPYRVKVVLYH